MLAVMPKNNCPWTVDFSVKPDNWYTQPSTLIPSFHIKQKAELIFISMYLHASCANGHLEKVMQLNVQLADSVWKQLITCLKDFSNMACMKQIIRWQMDAKWRPV